MSPSALEMGLPELLPELLPDFLPGNAQHTRVVLGLMGQQSAELAVAMGVPPAHIVAPAFNGVQHDIPEDSSGLHTLLTRQFDAAQTEVLVLKGPHGRTDFAENLLAAGFTVMLFEVYDRQPLLPEAPALQQLLNNLNRLVFG
ncbi:MAG: hypothetical protein HC848_10275 [Limnobacter sp.]|nr:hypothetical protein [Limnobacter sp.]